MKASLFAETEVSLREVDQIFSTSLEPWWDELRTFLPKIEDEVSFRAIPAMVIKTYGILGLEQRIALKMANMFKTIYFAIRIHELIKDDQEGQDHTQELQFTILIGDYIFGRVLKMLLESHTEELLDMFAAMICQINEGLIVKYKTNSDMVDILALTRAPFYKYAFQSGAHLAGFDQAGIEAYGQLGFQLGMAVELPATARAESAGYLSAAGGLLNQMEDSAVSSREGIAALILNLEGDWRR